MPRLIMPADGEALSSLHARAFAPGWSSDDIVNMSTSPAGFGLAIYLPAPVGMVLCRTIADEAEILTLAVDPDARRGGVGTALVEAAKAQARARGCVTLFLEVAQDNGAAISLYKQAEFHNVGIRRGYYARSTGAMDAIVMRHDLNSDAI